MRKFLLSATALTAMATVASAADLPVRAPAPAPIIAPIFTWTGFYVGVNAGGAWNNKCSSWTPTFAGAIVATNFPTLCGISNNDTTFTGGGQIGYNWQAGAFVFGLEADINGIAHSDNNVAFVSYGGVGILAPAGAGVYQLNSTRPDWFGTVRGRLGYTWGQALLYVTGGLAYGGDRSTTVNYWTAAANPPVGAPNATFAASKSNNVGWTIGGGLEYAFTTNWTARVEYLHVAFGSDNGGVVCSGGSCAGFASFNRNSNHNSMDVARVGVNYKFGGPAESVVARY